MSRLRPRGLRSRLLIVVLVGALATLAALTAGFNLFLDQRLGRDADNLLRTRAAAELATLSTLNGRLRVGEAPDAAAVDSQVWVYAESRALERPRASARDQGVADSLAAGRRRFVSSGASDTRLYAVPIVGARRRLGTLVVGASLVPYERTAHTALFGSMIFTALVLLLVGLAARGVIGGALRPVARMTSAAAEWGERDIDRRFALGPPRDELTRLAATFDGLLDRLAASLRREQRFSAELSHELRTPLAKVVAEAELALRRERSPAEYREALAAVRAAAAQLERTLETLVMAARADAALPHGSSDAARAASRAAEGCVALASERGVQVDLEPPPAPLRVAADVDLVERVLSPLVENACRHGHRCVRLIVAAEDGAVLFTVRDDGPGVPPGERERIFEPGVRGPEGGGNGAGAGLGLALSRRLARAAGGDVECVASGEGGAFRARLPAGLAGSMIGGRGI